MRHCTRFGTTSAKLTYNTRFPFRPANHYGCTFQILKSVAARTRQRPLRPYGAKRRLPRPCRIQTFGNQRQRQINQTRHGTCRLGQRAGKLVAGCRQADGFFRSSFRLGHPAYGSHRGRLLHSGRLPRERRTGTIRNLVGQPPARPCNLRYGAQVCRETP